MKHKILLTWMLISTSIYLVCQYVYQECADMDSKKTAFYLKSDCLFVHYTDNQIQQRLRENVWDLTTFLEKFKMDNVIINWE